MKKLKNTIVIIALLLITFSMKGQEIVRPIEERLRNNYMDYPNSYYKDTNNKLQNLIGTWIYDDGTNYFKITFFKEKVMENEHYNVFGDKLFTKFLYKKNGRVIYDNYGTNSYPREQGLINTKPSQIQSNFVVNYTIGFYYTEPSTNNCHRRRKLGSLDIIYNNSNPEKLYWKRTTDTRYFHTRPCSNGVEPDDSDFVIPEDMVLTKLQ
ncbi:DUF6705 family protein [Flavobacterium lindanitolerans]|jgi:hypothetical protein|uniref:DUF6705 family protein n=1 Tax=Flavobacterium lindanitolerans TaxID=428988 RepID=UPI0023F42F9A|nr:DUF6705 family protein [Flavobacterium lindanitolerans]